MIFKKQSFTVSPTSSPIKQPDPKSWKHRFRTQLYRRNYTSLLHDPYCHAENNGIHKSEAANYAAINFIENIRKYHTQFRDDEDEEEGLRIEHPYCTYIPLKKSVQFDDQIVNTFLCLRNLRDNNSLLEQDNFYSEVRKFLRNCKDAGKVKQGWQTCLKRFVIELDVIFRIDLFILLHKYGGSCLDQLYETYGKGKLKDIFIERIMSSNRYFQKQGRLNKSWKISLQLQDKITQANISKTMKMLYCSICLLYDCGKHKLQDLSNSKDHHYLNIKNQISKSTHISRAIELLKNMEKGVANNTDGELSAHFCSLACYKKLSKQKYSEMEIQKSRTVSPMVESIIKMGIEMFSYSPCLIKNLFPSNAAPISRVTCAIIFMYLLEEVNLIARMDFKICSSEVQLLKREGMTSASFNTLAKSGPVLKKKKPKKESPQEFKYQQVAICLHNFIGSEPFDTNCDNCACSRRGFCLPECLCGPNCPKMLQGCSCKSKEQCQSIKCSCYKSKNQCIPGVCLGCFPTGSNPKRNCCKNDQILRGCSKLIKIGFSKIPKAGFGAFAGQYIKKGALIAIYCGQVIEQEMENLRETLKTGESFYNFACSEGSIDARFMGNRTRFINHGNETEGKTNLVSLNMFSCGQEFIGLYASRNIQEGEELLFDYDGEGEMAKNYSQMYAFLRKEGKSVLKLQRTGSDTQ